MTLKPTSFSFDEDDVVLLTRLYDKTGISRVEIMRRLIRAYAGGLPIPGLPTVQPPIAVRAR